MYSLFICIHTLFLVSLVHTFFVRYSENYISESILLPLSVWSNFNDKLFRTTNNNHPICKFNEQFYRQLTNVNIFLKKIGFQVFNLMHVLRYASIYSKNKNSERNLRENFRIGGSKKHPKILIFLIVFSVDPMFGESYISYVIRMIQQGKCYCFEF